MHGGRGEGRGGGGVHFKLLQYLPSSHILSFKVMVVFGSAISHLKKFEEKMAALKGTEELGVSRKMIFP